MKRSIIILTILLSVFTVSCCKNPRPRPPKVKSGLAWLRQPDFDYSHDDKNKLGASDYYQVSATNKASAREVSVAITNHLKDKRFLKIDEKQAKRFVGDHYKCAAGKQPYLVRAVFGHSGTGRYTLLKVDDNIIVSHGSLGRSSVYNRSALVVNLDFEPKELYNIVSIAE